MKRVGFAFFCSFLLLSAGSAEEPSFKFPAASDYPPVRKEARRVADFVPRGWKIMARANGDLNGDKLPDTVLVIQGNFSKYKQSNSGNLGRDNFDTNPRLLIVLLKNPNGSGFRLGKQTRNVIAGADWPTMDEPFEKIAIKNGGLEIHVQSFYNAGSWTASNTVYKFQYRDGSLVLVGAEQDEVQRNTGEETLYSYNFLSGRLRMESKTIDSDLKKVVSWKRIHHNRLRDIDKFSKLYEWQVIPNCYL